jgi:hypothetical protein
MTHSPRLILQSAAIVTMLSTAPVLAAEMTVPGATAKSASHLTKHHHGSRVTRIAARYVRHEAAAASPFRADLGCAGAWCGRQMVLMIGIGY